MLKQWLISNINSSNRIYIIGIMKAGKSTFINLLLNKILFPNYRGPLNVEKKILDVDPGECTFMETEINLNNSLDDDFSIEFNYDEFDEISSEYEKKIERYDNLGLSDLIENISNVKQFNKIVDKNDKKYKHIRPGELRNKDNKIIISELTELKIFIRNRNVPEKMSFSIIDTPGFDSLNYQEQNLKTFENLKNASKIVVVVQLEKLEAKELLRKLVETLNDKYRDTPKILIVNIKEYKEQDFEDRVNFVKNEYLSNNGRFDKAYFINLQDALSDSKMGIIKYYNYNDNMIRIIDNGDFTIELWTEILTTPEQFFPDIIKRVLGKEYKIIQNNIEFLNIEELKSKLSKKISAASLSPEAKINGLEKECQDIQIYLSKKTYDFIEEELKLENDDDKIKFKVQKMLRDFTLNRIKNDNNDEIENDFDILEKVVVLSSEVLIESKLKCDKDDISSITHSFVDEIKNQLNNKKSAQEIVNNIKERYISEVLVVIKKFYKLWEIYLQEINRIYIQSQVNKRIKELIKSGEKYETQ